MRLGIDLDGVVAEFNRGWTALHNAEFGGSLTEEMVVSWDGLHTLAGFAHMEAFWEWARGNDERPSMFRHLDLVPDARETLQRLRSDGHDIVIVTTKPDWAVPDTLRWIADHELPTREIHFAHRKHEVSCDVYLDDAPVVLPDLVRHRPDALVCRFVRAWNDPVDGAVDVEDWSDFHAAVTEREHGARHAARDRA